MALKRVPAERWPGPRIEHPLKRGRKSTGKKDTHSWSKRIRERTGNSDLLLYTSRIPGLHPAIETIAREMSESEGRRVSLQEVALSALVAWVEKHGHSDLLGALGPEDEPEYRH